MKYIQTEKNAVLSARKKFVSMAGTYCLGVFNDNFFKQTVLLVAVSAGLIQLQGIATVLFALPFIIFSSYAGWLADRFSKKNVVIGSKALEVVAMLIGAVGLLTGNWVCILAMVFLMGAQSAFFSPALNGSIPELYPANYVPKANAILKLLTTLAILFGIACSGISLDQTWIDTPHIPFGHILVSVIVVSVSLVGFLLSLGVYSKKVSPQNISFPWLGPVHSLKDLKVIFRDKQLFLAISADCFFYFLASLAVLTINVLGLEQLGFSQTATSLLSMSLMVGICLGSLVAAKIMSMESWHRYLVISAGCMSVGLFLAGCVSRFSGQIQIWWLVSALGGTGVAGGLFLIPVTSFLQVRPASTAKGRVLAASNFCGFIAILSSGFVFNKLSTYFSPAETLQVLALLSSCVACLFFLAKQKIMHSGKPFLSSVLRTMLALRYRVTVAGMENLELDEKKGILFLPNHPALIDPVIVMSVLYRRFQPRPLSDEDQVSKPFVRQIMKLVKPIILPSLQKNGRRRKDHVERALDTVVESLQRGEQIILYPSGRLYRSNKEQLLANSAVETIVRSVPDVQVVLIRTTGLWGSSFSRAAGVEPSLVKHIRRYIGSILSGGVFFMPKRKVSIELVRDEVVPSLSDRRVINGHLESFYNARITDNTHVPYYWWQGRKEQIVEEPANTSNTIEVTRVSATVKKQVLEKLEELVGQKVEEGQHLANDLAMDSLMLMEVIGWLENEFGVAIEDSSAFFTVDDCILAAAGKMITAGDSAKPGKIPESWFQKENRDLVFEQYSTITECFISQFAKSPKRILFGDEISGCKSNRDIVTAVHILKPFIQRMEGENIGIMLPASVSASISYLATISSGRTPVLFNWTSGIANMDHGIKLTGTKTIITARKLYQRIEEQQGVDLSKLDIEWFFLDELSGKIRFFNKIAAVMKAHFFWKSLVKTDVAETAAILFTSGSESKPKAVPLTHTNILSNMKNFSDIVPLSSEDKLLGMLPPFHSLGLVGTIILPLCTGLKTIYHANPTESVTLSRLVGTYKATMTIGTPTFIDNILQAGSAKQLESLRVIFTGAEKCPAHVYNRMKKVIPGGELCEGYGITECSPLVSINAPGAAKEGSIGKILPSIEYVIVHPETGMEVKTGEKGVLLVRGASIFNGYYGDDTGKGFRQCYGKQWYDTGDFVREDDDKTLSFCGRQKRFIKLAGEMISLPAIENVLLDYYRQKSTEGPILAVSASQLDGHPEIVLYSTFSIDREAINAVIKKGGLSPLHNIRKIEHVDEIPLLGSGKTDYQLLQKQLVTC